MAGLGSRFSKVGYSKPKPLIEFSGKTMIEHVMENLYIPDAKFHLICQASHVVQYEKDFARIQRLNNVAITPIDSITEGTACSVLFARNKIDPSQKLLIANCDQIVDFNVLEFVENMTERDLDGSILIFRDENRDPKWSYAKIENDLVTEVREKLPISDFATVGLYLFRQASDFIDGAIQMIIENDRTNGEFYTAPVYNYLQGSGAKIGIYEIDQVSMHGIGTPDDLEKYLSSGRVK